MQLFCEDCETVHTGEYAYTNNYGQIMYNVEEECEHNDHLSSEAGI